MKINKLDLEQLMYMRDIAEEALITDSFKNDSQYKALQAETELYLTLHLMAGSKRYKNYIYVGDKMRCHRCCTRLTQEEELEGRCAACGEFIYDDDCFCYNRRNNEQ